MKKRQLAIGCLTVLAALIVLTVVVLMQMKARHLSFLKQYRAKAVAEVAQMSGDRQWLTNEFLRALQNQDNRRTDNLLVMDNDEWIVFCARACHDDDHELLYGAIGAGLGDVFLGKASDSKWYYSTWHFCPPLMIMQTRSSLKDFAERHCLREFDGDPDKAVGYTKPKSSR